MRSPGLRVCRIERVEEKWSTAFSSMDVDLGAFHFGHIETDAHEIICKRLQCWHCSYQYVHCLLLSICCACHPGHSHPARINENSFESCPLHQHLFVHVMVFVSTSLPSLRRMSSIIVLTSTRDLLPRGQNKLGSLWFDFCIKAFFSSQLSFRKSHLTRLIGWLLEWIIGNFSSQPFPQVSPPSFNTLPVWKYTVTVSLLLELWNLDLVE